jgi:hypothetical protein
LQAQGALLRERFAQLDANRREVFGSVELKRTGGCFRNLHAGCILLKIRPYKETVTRCFIFNQKLEQVVRVDSIAQSCALLPEEHGIIFPDGFYLAAGELKQFEGRDPGLGIERVIHAPTGEDSLYVFYNGQTGEYVLMPYRLTTQKIEERITCHGFSLFANGHLVSFRAETEPQKHHMIQLRQTPFYQPGFEPAGKKDAFLYKVGNKDVVRCLAECNEVLTLVRKENPYALRLPALQTARLVWCLVIGLKLFARDF